MSIHVSLSYQKKKEDYNKHDELGVCIYYYSLGKKIKISTGVKTKLKDWNFNLTSSYSKDFIKRTDSDYLEKNLIIRQKIKEIEDIIYKINLNFEIPTTDLLKSYLKSNLKVKKKKTFKQLGFLFILNEYLDFINTKSVLRDGYKRTLRSNLNRISEFVILHQNEVNYKFTINDIDEDFQWKFLNYLNDKGEQPTTIRKRFTVLSSLVNWSRDNGYSDHNFKIISFSHENEREVIYLNRDEVLQLYKFDLFNYNNEKHTSYTKSYITDYLKSGRTITYTDLEVYRDILVFGCGIGGRFGDIVKLKLDNYQFSDDRTKGFFVFSMEKSRTGKKVKVPINNLTFQIWKKYSKNKSREDYLFPRTKKGKPIFNEMMNRSLKEIGRIVGLKRLVSKPKFSLEGQVIEGSDLRKPLYKFLTTHIMRRTFIREGVENNIPTHVLMSMSGHTTEKVFRRYFSTTTKELDEEGKKMFSMDLSEKDFQTNEKIENNIEGKLKELKDLFEKGLIPEEIYHRKVSELV